MFSSWVLKATEFKDSNLTNLWTRTTTADRAQLGIRLARNMNAPRRGQAMFNIAEAICRYRPVNLEVLTLIGFARCVV